MELQLAGIEMAERQDISYVRSPRLLLRFLRCDHWDATKAASRMIRFFDWKLELFGEANLARDICLQDLQPVDIKSLKKGYFQRFPERDRAGRAIWFTVYQGQTYDSIESLVRWNFSEVQFFYLAFLTELIATLTTRLDYGCM